VKYKGTIYRDDKMDKKISVAMISGLVGKTPEQISRSFIFDEAYRLAKRGINIHIIRPKVEGDSFSYGIQYLGLKRKIDLQAFGFMVKNLPTYPLISLLRRPESVYKENLYAMNVSKLIKEKDVDLIHAHFAHYEGLVGMLAKKKTGKPLVITVHGYDILVEQSIGYGVRLRKKFDAIVRRVLNDANAIITASKVMFNEVSKIVNNISKVYLIPNAVDIKRFNPSLNISCIKKRLGLKEVYIVFTLRRHEDKNGLEYLIRAAQIVTKDKEDVFFIIGGDGSLRTYHEQLAIKLGLKNRVIFTGNIPYIKVPYYYAMSDIIVVPSLQEAFGLVVSEAMACGKPVIGSRVGGIPDQIVDAHNGFLVQPKNSVEISEKILWLIEHHKKAKRMGMNGRKIIEEKFNIKNRIDEIIQLYEDLIK
jgi:glycosyltransferase involved in cell wall biosynthesis